MTKRHTLSTDAALRLAHDDGERFDRWMTRQEEDDLMGLELGDTATSGYMRRATNFATSHRPSTYERCHVKHPELIMGAGVLVGASCSAPRPGFDVYVGFDYTATDSIRQPWDPEDPAAPIHAAYKIQDMAAPKDVVSFKRMVNWLADQLRAGKRVHIGCVGGHGRTGLVIAALRFILDGDTDAVAWTRKHHCHKAVETKEQMQWLHTHFGLKMLPASKSFSTWDNKTFAGKYGKEPKGSGKSRGKSTALTGPHPATPPEVVTLTPMRGGINLLPVD